MVTRVTLHNDGADTVSMPVVALARDTWNGFAVPVVTADTLRNFVAAMARVDPNGDWSGMGQRFAELPNSDGGHTLYLWRAGESFRDGDVWRSVGTIEIAGVMVPIYALDGWVWETVPPAETYTLTVSSRVLNYLSDLVDIDDDADETFRPLSVRQDAADAIADAFTQAD